MLHLWNSPIFSQWDNSFPLKHSFLLFGFLSFSFLPPFSLHFIYFPSLPFILFISFPLLYIPHFSRWVESISLWEASSNPPAPPQVTHVLTDGGVCCNYFSRFNRANCLLTVLYTVGIHDLPITLKWNGFWSRNFSPAGQGYGLCVTDNPSIFKILFKERRLCRN